MRSPAVHARSLWRCTAFGLVLVLGSATASAAEGARGHLLVIGGGQRPASITNLFVCLVGGPKGKVLILPQASAVADAGRGMEQELKALGVGQVHVLRIDRAGADSDDAIRAVAGATGVYFGGGSQSRLMAVLQGTRVESALRALYADGATMAGTSAGAAVMSRVMITGRETRPLSEKEAWQTIEAGNVVTADGLGFLADAVVDQHFVRRRRHNRLISLVLERPRLLGIAIDEGTAVWVRPDRTFEVVGDGPVLTLDASGAAVEQDQNGHGLRGSGLRLDVLRAGAQYDLDSRKVTRLGRPSTPAADPSGCVPR